MRYVMFNWLAPEDVASWEGWTDEQKEADVEQHRAWFAKFGDKVVGGEELDQPARVKTLRRGRQGEGVIVTDGPYVEVKELLGGFVVIEAADIEEAVTIAAEWPSLHSMPNPTVQVHPVYERG